DPAGVDELFRLAHSLKGSAAAMELGAIARLAHQLEDLISRMRGASGRLPAPVVELLAAVAGRLEAMVAAASEGRPLADADDLSERIREAASERSSFASGTAEAATEGPAARLPGTTRVRTDALDRLLEEAGELVFGVARLRERARDPAEEANLDRELAALQRQVKGLHARVLGARLTPVSILTERLQRMARALGKSMGKEVELEVEGAETELDRSLLDGLADPLGHLVRNCVHHGIEPAPERMSVGKHAAGKLHLRIRRRGDRAVIEVEDDGRGIDAEALRLRAAELGLLPRATLEVMSRDACLSLCLLPGLSTSGVNDVSGRGVGMDAVARALERLGGSVAIRSERGEGTRFTLDLPSGVAVAPVLLVGAGEEVLAIPVSRVVAATQEDAATRAALELAGDPTPRFHLAALLDPDSPPERRFPMFGQPRPCVIVDADGGQVALHVDRLVGYEEAVLRPLAPPLDRAPGIAGATLLASGLPVFVLDVRRLLEAAGVRA
ncbi:MAG TPA: ATP-binding protein, partial [Vulgatibacter sp.]